MSSLPSLTWSRVPAPVICIPAYKRFSLQSVGSGKKLSVHIGIVRKTSWSLFLIATGLWTESDSFLCCIFSPLVFRTSIAQCSFIFFLPPWHKLNRGCHHLKKDTTEKKRLNLLSAFHMHQICRSFMSHCTSWCVIDALIHLLLSQIFNSESEEILSSGT